MSRWWWRRSKSRDAGRPASELVIIGPFNVLLVAASATKRIDEIELLSKIVRNGY